MWIFTNRGFISAVAWRDDARYMCVRARVKQHLQSLFPNLDVIQFPGADYPFRVKVSRDQFQLTVLDEMRDIDYDDFKSSLSDEKYHNVCSQIWSVAHQLQGLSGRD